MIGVRNIMRISEGVLEGEKWGGLKVDKRGIERNEEAIIWGGEGKI